MYLPVYDNHLHLSPSGRNIDALREFKASGGTGLTLVNLPYPEVPITKGSDFEKAYDITIKYAEEGRELGLKINVAIGPYPILLIPLAEKYGLEKAENIMIEGMDIAGRLISEGKAQLIGEVGRPHFPCDEKYVHSCNRVLQHGFDIASSIDCAVMIHCESDSQTFESLSKMALSSNLNPKKVVKHSSIPASAGDFTYGVSVSTPASRKGIRESLIKGKEFMIETDFIDDLSKPGAIMSVNTVPKRIKAMYSSGEMDYDTIYHICEDIPDSLYTR